MSQFDDRETGGDAGPAAMLCRNLELAGTIVDARLAGGELERRREHLKQAARRKSAPPTARIDLGALSDWPPASGSGFAPPPPLAVPFGRGHDDDLNLSRAAATGVRPGHVVADDPNSSRAAVALACEQAEDIVHNCRTAPAAGTESSLAPRSWLTRARRPLEQQSDERADRVVARRRALVLVAVMMLGFAGTGLAVAEQRRGNEVRVAQSLDQQTQLTKQALNAELTRYDDTLTDVAVTAGAQDRLTASNFGTFTMTINEDRLPAGSAISFVVAADSAQIPQVQKQWGTTLRPADGLSSHLLPVAGEPMWGAATGGFLDFAAEPGVAESFELSRTTDEVAASAPYLPRWDRSLPEEMSVVLSAPVWAPPSDGDSFRGWVVTELRMSDLVDTAASVSDGTVSVDLGDITVVSPGSTRGSARTPMGEGYPAHAEGDSPIGVANVNAGQREWQLRLTSTGLPRTDDAPREGVAWLTGSLITVLMVALTASMPRPGHRNRRRHEQSVRAYGPRPGDRPARDGQTDVASRMSVGAHPR
ncbi:CHASE domain-containing protein [Actinoplanes bogorensis]|uniref:CHASE domain-containing protein n=1 Tax=Paractinoplanes bogorensis TaxID=1610840 RepID=A0ABS5YU63_9ACTN|nr:CHASE domain-containing protein [Actinoplanes bogorensis]MBU2667000.1 CHASE domain-containing protein [Actinoplanes bogorensis]